MSQVGFTSTTIKLSIKSTLFLLSSSKILRLTGSVMSHHFLLDASKLHFFCLISKIKSTLFLLTSSGTLRLTGQLCLAKLPGLPSSMN